MTLPSDYFDRLYAGSADPWGFGDRWYELRKRAITLACLPRERYRSAYEPGCSLGLLSQGLADRCDELLASDAAERPLGEARRLLAGQVHVRVARQRLPADWPVGSFDLIVLSEFLYYFDDADLATTAGLAAAAVNPGGSLVAVHWLHPVQEYPQSGASVQAAVDEAAAVAQPALVRTVTHVEADFALAVYVRPEPGEDPAVLSVGARQGLC